MTHKTDIDFGYTSDHARKNADTQLPAIQCWQNQYKRDYDIHYDTGRNYYHSFPNRIIHKSFF